LTLASPESLLILDDALGRRVARSHRLTYTGTLGVLVKAKQEGFVSRLAPLIEDLRRTTMFLSPELIALVLAEAGEA
jgi:predicted nucleic acid-binding protein